MNVNKRNKIQAKLDHPSTPEHEREVCRKILGESRAKESGAFWGRALDGEFDVNDSIISGCLYFDEAAWQIPCKQCDNLFWSSNLKNIYCPICLAAKRREAEG